MAKQNIVAVFDIDDNQKVTITDIIDGSGKSKGNSDIMISNLESYANIACLKYAAVDKTNDNTPELVEQYKLATEEYNNAKTSDEKKEKLAKLNKIENKLTIPMTKLGDSIQLDPNYAETLKKIYGQSEIKSEFGGQRRNRQKSRKVKKSKKSRGGRRSSRKA